MFLWRVSRICEEFGCLPSAAKRELEEDQERMAEQILPLRAYAATKQAYDEHCRRGESADKLPALPLMGEVMRNDFERQKARIKKREDA